MKAKVDEKGNLTIGLEEVFESMTPEARKEAAKILCASPVLMGAVLECVSRGEYFSDDDRGAWWFGPAQVLELREKLLPLMPEVAREGVREALSQRNAARSSEEETRKWAWGMFHAWPEEHSRFRPEHPRGYAPPPKPSEEEVDEIVKGGAR